MIIVNGQEILSSVFPGGEVDVSIKHMVIYSVNTVTAYLYSSDDVMKLMLTVDAIRREIPECVIHLDIPYFPYGRQDRVCKPGEAFSLEVMCKMINSLGCFVRVTDPHSEKTVELLDNCLVTTQEDIFKDNNFFEVIQKHNMVLVSPDAGASEKVRYLSEKYRIDAIYCTKQRSNENGHPYVVLPTGVDYQGVNFIVIDDICDGGRTFTGLAEKLKAMGAGDLYLYVTHGIFSAGLPNIHKHYKHIYCDHIFFHETGRELLSVRHGIKVFLDKTDYITVFKRSLLDKGEI